MIFTFLASFVTFCYMSSLSRYGRGRPHRDKANSCSLPQLREHSCNSIKYWQTHTQCNEHYTLYILCKHIIIDTLAEWNWCIIDVQRVSASPPLLLIDSLLFTIFIINVLVSQVMSGDDTHHLHSACAMWIRNKTSHNVHLDLWEECDIVNKLTISITSHRKILAGS